MQISRKAVYTFILLFLIGNAQAAQVIIYPSNKTVNQGETFSINISVDPQGTSISGAQLNILFNESVLNVNSITEGNLFKKNGANTFFNSGVIINSNGTVKNIFGLIIGPNNISTLDTFAIVNFTAIGRSEATEINFSNVIISDPAGKSVDFTINNGRINFNDIQSILPVIEDLNNDNLIDVLDLVISGTAFWGNKFSPISAV